MNRPNLPHPALTAKMSMPLFKIYPELAGRLTCVSLGNFPTPVERLDRVAKAAGLSSLYIKRDDLSGGVYGGNKVRKLEFLLGDAIRRKAKEVVTFGFDGSNHAVATAIYAGKLGLGCTSLLMSQVNAHYVRRNLLAGYYFKADLCHYKNWPMLSLGLVRKLLQGRIKNGVPPRIIPAGGSCPLGVLGYVNAAFELREQILAAELPEPDVIYVPLGSMGTSVGLKLGLAAAGIKSRVVAVRVIEKKYASLEESWRLFSDTVSLLRRTDASFPKLAVSKDDFEIRDDCLGEGYGRFTEAGVKAASLVMENAKIVLNGTYSAKAFSALLSDAAKGLLKGKTALFWNTYNSRDLSTFISQIDYHRLPRGFHRYFEENVQPLDQEGFDR